MTISEFPKNVYQVQKYFRAIAVANAVQAAHGSVQDYEDALQDGLLVAMEAFKSADPRKGDPIQYVCTRMMAARQDARKQALAPYETESDLATPAGDGDDLDDEGVLEGIVDGSFQGLEDFDRPEWAEYGELTSSAELDVWQLAILERLEHMTVPVVPDTDGTADEKAPTYVFPVPEPTRQPGAAFAIYGSDPDTVQAEGMHAERVSSMQDENGVWPDSGTNTPDEIDVLDEDGTLIGEEEERDSRFALTNWGTVVEREGAHPDDLMAEDDEDAPYEPFVAIPTQETVEADLVAFFQTLEAFPAKHSAASRETYIRATLHGAGVKAAQASAWAVHRGLAVKAVRSGLVTGSGRIIPWNKAIGIRLSQPDYAVCAKVVEHLAAVPAAMQWVDARVAA